MNYELSIIIPYYNQPEMLAKQIEYWHEWPEEVEIIVVDDGSQDYPALSVLEPVYDVFPQLSLYRVKEDIPWNQPGARNLGFKVAKAPWCINDDIDHVFDGENVRKALELTRDMGDEAKYFFQMNRVKPDGSPINKMHPSLYLIRKETYWDIGGFNEDFSGHYGWDDFYFAWLLEHLGYEKVPKYEIKFFCFNGEEEAVGGETHSPGLDRDSSHNNGLLNELKRGYQGLNTIDKDLDYSNEDNIRFEWERIK